MAYKPNKKNSPKKVPSQNLMPDWFKYGELPARAKKQDSKLRMYPFSFGDQVQIPGNTLDIQGMGVGGSYDFPLNKNLTLSPRGSLSNTKGSIGGNKIFNEVKFEPGLSLKYNFQQGGSLPKYQDIKDPIYVTDPNDPRLKSYEDSLFNYNIGEKLKGVMAPISRTSGPGSGSKKLYPFRSEEEIKYWEENEGKAYYKIPHTYWNTGEELPYWRAIQDNIENARKEGHGILDNTKTFETLKDRSVRTELDYFV